MKNARNAEKTVSKQKSSESSNARFLRRELKTAKMIVEKCKKGASISDCDNKLIGYMIDCKLDISKYNQTGTFIHKDLLKRAKKLIRKNKTAEECLQDLHNTMINLRDTIAKEMGIKWIIDKLSKLLSCTHRNAGEARERVS
jgi:hypothetical protein